MGKEFRPMLAPTARPWTYAPSASAKLGLDKITKLPIFLIFGSLFQLALSALLPLRWAVVPLLSYLVISLLSLLLAPSPPALPLNVVPGRTSAQLPRAEDGSFHATPAEDSLVVFHIGAQFNHPLGVLCPGGKETGERFNKLVTDLQARKDELGVLSVSNGTSSDDGSFTTTTTIYFKDVKKLHDFAHEPMHREAWDWFAAQKFPHLGVYHETFLVPKKNYECVYLNCKPLLMGKAAVKTIDEKTGEEKWVNSLVSADTPALKTQYARLGRDRNGDLLE